MTTFCFVLIFLSVYMLQFMFCVDPGPTPTSGPFKISISNIKDCSNPSKPYIKNPPVVFDSRTHNSTAMSGNITFFRDTKNLKIKLRSFIVRNGNWEPALLVNSLDCHSMVLHFLCAAVTVKYDRKSCTYFKGSYAFENVDVNQLLHFWLPKAQYGHIIFRVETYSQAGTFYCKDFYTSAEPA